MTILYSCRIDGDQYRITKWDDGSVESSYLCTETECECPAGHRPMCRHREMLPRFLSRGAVNTGWHFDYDRGGWVDNRTFVEVHPSSEPEPSSEPAQLGTSISDPEGATMERATQNSAEGEPAVTPVSVVAPPRPTWRRF